MKFHRTVHLLWDKIKMVTSFMDEILISEDYWGKKERDPRQKNTTFSFYKVSQSYSRLNINESGYKIYVLVGIK